MTLEGMTVKIGPYFWEIGEKNEKEFEDYGQSSEDDLKITLRKNLPKKVKQVILLHELLHSMVSANGVTFKNEEMVVDFFSRQIVIFIEQNPEFVKYLGNQLIS